MDYYHSLPPDVRKRYDDKISVLGVDPYSLKHSELNTNPSLWPEVNYVDVVHYLLFEQSTYTKDQLRNYKSLDAYKLFQDGWVKNIGHKLVNNVHLILAKVTHSMRVREKPLEPWIIISANGTIDSAHCTCMAGLGESCSHVAAVLFSLETASRIRNETSVTDVPAYWTMPTATKFDAPYKRIRDMDFQSAEKKRKLLVGGKTELSVCKSNPLDVFSSPTGNEESEFFSDLNKVMPSAAILSLTPNYADGFKPKSLTQKWPVDMSTLSVYAKDNCNDLDSIVTACKQVDISLTEEEAENVKRNTSGQSKSKFWHQFRAGRITASKIHAACHTRVENPSATLLRGICAPTTSNVTCAAIDWGVRNESRAKEEFVRIMQKQHTNFHVKDSGLILDSNYPEFGASPDGLTYCDCCQSGCLEIKCPFSMREASEISVPWLNMSNEQMRLVSNHPYYYQIQLQLLLANRDKAYFFVWTPNTYHLEEIMAHKDFQVQMVQRAKEFHSICVMPELVYQYYTKKRALQPVTTQVQVQPTLPVDQNNNDLFCICRGRDDGRKMIMCDNENCNFIWFHTACINLKRVPKGKWFCSYCR